MKLTGLALGAAMLAGLGAGAAQAMPLAPAGASPEAGIVQVRGGCGFGAHRGPYGGCRLNRGPRGDMRRMMTGAPRGCPPGMYRGPRGYCR